MSVELRQLVGKRKSKRHGEVTIRQPVDIIYRDDTPVGQIARHSNASVIFIREGTLLPDEEKKDIINEVVKLRGADRPVKLTEKIRQAPSEEDIDKGIAEYREKHGIEEEDAEDPLDEERAEQGEARKPVKRSKKK